MGANATTSVPTYVAGEVLTAADLNITNSGIPVFADSTARTNGFGGTGEKALAEGQYAYLESDDKTYVYNGSTWKEVGASAGVVQVKTATKTDTFSTTSTTFTDLTGISVSITPTSASNLVLVLAAVNVADPADGTQSFLQLVRGTTAIGIGDAASNRIRTSGAGRSPSSSSLSNVAINFLDSPATTSATTYKLQIRSSSGSTVYCNRSGDDGDTSSYARTISTIVVMEVTP